MLRSATSRASAIGARSIATNTSTTASATQSAASTTSGSATTPPSAPPPTPAGGGGFIRRIIPLTLISGSGYFVYKAGSDNEFRKNVEQTIPGSAAVLEYIPGPTLPDSLKRRSNEIEEKVVKRSTNSEDSTLPQNYKPVPKLLLEIEGSESSTADSKSNVAHANSGSEQSDLQLASSKLSYENMTPSQRAATKAKELSQGISNAEAGDGPMANGKKEPIGSSGISLVATAASASEKASTKLKNIADDHEALVEALNASDDDNRSSKEGKSSARDGKNDDNRSAIAKILGKGDFSTENAVGPDVLDKSEYERPGLSGSGGTSTSAPNKSYSSSKWWWSSKKKAPTFEGGSTLSEEDAMAITSEISSLKAELESQTKWEAVRLQEAVRAQMAEDQKLADINAVGVSQKHAEELSRVRLEALEAAENVLRERTKEMREKTEREMNLKLDHILAEKEHELRTTLSLEYQEKAKQECAEREQALTEAKAQVDALSNHFDALVQQTEKAKAAAENSASAFLLRESLKNRTPLSEHLRNATDESELSKILETSVPRTALDRGVGTIDDLKLSFQSACRRGLSAAMVPEGQSGTIWGHLLGAIFSRMKIPVDIRIEKNQVAQTNEEKLRLAKLLVEEGDIEKAVKTLEGLHGLSATIMNDWIDEAKAHLAAEMAADALLAQAIISQALLSSSYVVSPSK